MLFGPAVVEVLLLAAESHGVREALRALATLRSAADIQRAVARGLEDFEQRESSSPAPTTAHPAPPARERTGDREKG
ncbi:hypothetical protein [Oryza sativa Japonica Group]|uniref:Uncharacterized protein n=1 Tax=Oryza sativa subsp. japonica TaxID=39947 RepID=Q5SNI4_ORYSJ|nr:hypothetical protein [Oryza sativa Japonica Group]